MCRILAGAKSPVCLFSNYSNRTLFHDADLCYKNEILKGIALDPHTRQKIDESTGQHNTINTNETRKIRGSWVRASVLF